MEDMKDLEEIWARRASVDADAPMADHLDRPSLYPVRLRTLGAGEISKRLAKAGKEGAKCAR